MRTVARMILIFLGAVISFVGILVAMAACFLPLAEHPEVRNGTTTMVGVGMGRIAATFLDAFALLALGGAIAGIGWALFRDRKPVEAPEE